MPRRSTRRVLRLGAVLAMLNPLACGGGPTTPAVPPTPPPPVYPLCAFASMGECPVAVLWVRRSETNRPSKCLEDTRGELARKGLTHRRMSNDSPKIKWSCQRVNEQVGVGIPRQFPGRDGLLDQV